MGPEKEKYIDYLAAHPEIKNINFDFNLDGIAEHFNTHVEEIEVPLEIVEGGPIVWIPGRSIAWEDAIGTPEEWDEFVYKLMNDALKSMEEAEPMDWPKSKQPMVDVRKWLEQRGYLEEKEVIQVNPVATREEIAINN